MNNLYSKNSDIKISFKGDDLAIIGEIPFSLKKFYHKPSEEFTRFLPCNFHHIISILNQNRITFKTSIDSNFDLSYSLTALFNLRSYQEDALNQWSSNKYCGTIILPTGAGKTILGLAAIQKIDKKTLIIVPTIDLLTQWIKSFIWFKEFSNEHFELIGQYGGGEKNLRPITVSTYESARLYSRKLRDKFGLLIFDEVHHLSGRQWQEIARAYIAPYRLGLTATLNSQDEGFEPITTYIGQIVYKLTPQELQGIGAISHYELRKKFVMLSTEQQKEYSYQIQIFNNYVTKKGLYGKKGFQKLIYHYNDPLARHALKAHRKSREIAFNAPGKLQAIAEIFENHPEEQIILFCESISFIENVSEKFLIPIISSRTPTKERKELLKDFKNNKIRILSAGRVLDEGIDVKASIGVIVSGSAQERQFIQRLGRLLRPHHKNKNAILYEIITKGTSETKTANRRKINS